MSDNPEALPEHDSDESRLARHRDLHRTVPREVSEARQTEARQAATPPATEPPKQPEVDSLGIAREWSVTVDVPGGMVLMITHDHYCGLQDLEPYEPTIRSAAENLLGFIGASQQAATPAPAEPVARVGIGQTSLGRRATFFTLTDAGRALPDGTYDFYTAPPATPAPAERDAARYRWLRDESRNTPEPMREVCAVMFRAPFTDDPDVSLFGGDLDAAIDAAMGAAPPATPAAQPAEPAGEGWTGNPPGLLQDDCRGLSRALASKPDARRHAREAAAAIAAQAGARAALKGQSEGEP